LGSIHNYSSIADIQNYWLSDIASKYFNFSDTNNYKIGIFGYINEVMSTVTQDAFNSINVAKREFYAASAENIDSFYKMAGNYEVDIPLVVPAKCNIALFITEKDIIENSSIVDGTYTFILDNTMEILADGIQFTLDYPIRILARYSNGKYNYTTYYDTTKNNSLAKISSKYIQNKCVNINNTKYLALSIGVQQYVITNKNENITKNSSIETTSLIFQYDGDLAGFDIYYTENPGVSVEEHIPKYDINDITPAGKFCIYEYLPDNKIRITFPRSAYFSPKINAEIRCAIYTSGGTSNEFDEFLGDLECSCQSDDYPYNNGLMIRGVVNGKCSGAIDKQSDEDFKRDVRYAIKTNSTITCASDLEEFFNDVASDKQIRVKFSKNRDDALYRIYNSFVLLKDNSDNVIPTNSCDIIIKRSEFDEFQGDRGIIKPGKIFQYTSRNDGSVEIVPYKLSDSLPSELENSDTILFANPFLIACAMENGIVGYYGNAISEIHNTEFTFVEDRTVNQFICLGFQIDRNPIAGEKYYTFTVKISSSSDLDPATLVTITDKENEDNLIRARYDGVVSETFYKDGAVWFRVKYITDNEDESTEDIQISTYSTINEDGESFTYHTGYSMNFDVLDTFVQGDILAVKKDKDLGKVRGCIDIDNTLTNHGMYIPLYIEEYDEEKDAYTMRAYISTNDFISLNQTITLDHGIYMTNGLEDNSVAIPMENTTCTISIFYKDDIANYVHNMWGYSFFKNYTLTNQYSTPSSEAFSLAKGITFFKSNLKFIDNTTIENVISSSTGMVSNIYTENNNVNALVKYDDGTEEIIVVKKGVIDTSGNISYTNEFELKYEVGVKFDSNAIIASKQVYEGDIDDYQMRISLTPLTRADWIKNYDNYNTLINKIYKTFDVLYEAYFSLENQYGISMSLFNTYGKSNRYEVGNYNAMYPLSRVNCSMSIGVEVDAMTNITLFTEKLRLYIKEFIESFNDLDQNGKPLFIIDLLGDIKDEFPEIIHVEYYGFNEYGTEAQVISPKKEDAITTDYVQTYVPEFINIYTYTENGITIPKIDIRILNSVALQ